MEDINQPKEGSHSCVSYTEVTVRVGSKGQFLEKGLHLAKEREENTAQQLSRKPVCAMWCCSAFCQGRTLAVASRVLEEDDKSPVAW